MIMHSDVYSAPRGLPRGRCASIVPVVLASGLALGASGCVLPLNVKEPGSPDVVGSTRVVCTEPNDTLTVQGGGHWTDARGRGFYRLIVARGWPTMKNSGAYLQWVQRNDSGPPELVRETLALPLAPRLVNIERASLEISPSGVACVAVESSGRPAHWYSWGPVMLNDARELGAPGQTQPVKACFWDR